MVGRLVQCRQVRIFVSVTNIRVTSGGGNEVEKHQADPSPVPPAAETCPVQKFLDAVGGKWKPMILYFLRDGQIRRFGELTRLLSGISPRMLTRELRDLEHNGLIVRQVFAEVPPRVEYRLTPLGQSVIPICDAMAQWGDGCP